MSGKGRETAKLTPGRLSTSNGAVLALDILRANCACYA